MYRIQGGKIRARVLTWKRNQQETIAPVYVLISTESVNVASAIRHPILACRRLHGAKSNLKRRRKMERIPFLLAGSFTQRFYGAAWVKKNFKFILMLSSMVHPPIELSENQPKWTIFVDLRYSMHSAHTLNAEFIHHDTSFFMLTRVLWQIIDSLYWGLTHIRHHRAAIRTGTNHCFFSHLTQNEQILNSCIFRVFLSHSVILIHSRVILHFSFQSPRVKKKNDDSRMVNENWKPNGNGWTREKLSHREY